MSTAATRAAYDLVRADLDRWQRKAEHLAAELARCQTDYAEREEQLTREARHLDEQLSETDDRNTELVDQLAAAEYERDELRVDYQRACSTIATMHAAAIGSVNAPIRGVVEDVADVRIERDKLAAAVGEQYADLTAKLADAEHERDIARRNREADLAAIRRAMGIPAGNAHDIALRLRRWADAHQADEQTRDDVIAACAAAEQERDDLRKLHTETRNANRGLARRLESTEQERADAARLVETLRAENRRLADDAADARQRLATWHADEHTAQRLADRLADENRRLRHDLDQADAYARETPRGVNGEDTRL